MAIIQSGAGASLLTVDPTSLAARGTLYDAAGNVISPANRGAVVDSVGGVLLSGKDHLISRTLRASPDGSLRTSDDTLLLYDSVEGAAVDTNKWIQTTSTQTIVQATGAITFNNGSSALNATGAMHVSHRQFPFLMRGTLSFRSRIRLTAHFNNSQAQFGFATAPASVVAIAVANGAFWRKDSSGQLLPVVCINSAETLGTPISDATFRASVPTTDYAIFSVLLEETRATFEIRTSLGVLVNAQVVTFSPTSTGFSATHLAAYHHHLNTGATGTAVQMQVAGTAVFALDSRSQARPETISSGMNLNALTSPTAYTQAAQWANSADPAAAALANGTPSYTSLGGKWIGPTPTPAGAVTDFPLFAWTNPSPYTFFVSGYSLSTINRGAAVATTATVIEWGLAFNAQSGSLAAAAPYPPMRRSCGLQTFAIGAAIDSPPTPPVLQEQFATPYAVQPGRTIIVIFRVVQGTATASGFLRGNVAIDGWYE